MFFFGCSSSKMFFSLLVVIVHNIKNILQKHSWLLSWVELWKVSWLWGWSENGVPSSVSVWFTLLTNISPVCLLVREVFICCFLPCLKDTVTKAWHDDDKLGNILHPVVGSLYLKMCRSRVYVYMAYLISSCFVSCWVERQAFLLDHYLMYVFTFGIRKNVIGK